MQISRNYIYAEAENVVENRGVFRALNSVLTGTKTDIRIRV